MERTIFKNARIITQNRLVPGSLLVEDGRIASLCEGDMTADGAAVVDAGGRYLSPGFIDLHNHGRMGYDAMDAREEGLAAIARGQLAHGVTGFCITTSTNTLEVAENAMKTAVSFIEKEHADMSQPLGIYSEGIYFSTPKRGAHPPELLRPVCAEELTRFLKAGGGHLKIFALSPEVPGALEGIALLKEAGVTVTAAHSDATFAQAMAGIDAGITQATHTFNGMRALDHRDPAVVGACLVDDRVVCEAIVDGIHLHPGTVELMVRLKGPDRVALVSDSVFGNGLPDGEHKLASRTVTIKEGAIRLADGRLAGSTLSLDAAVRNTMRFARVPVWQAVRMASLVPARVLGVEKAKGSIEAGKDADLVLFDDEIRIQEVFLRGVRCQLLPQA